MRKINLIVIHCSATRVTQDFTVGELEACHLARGFRDIGYHYYITKDGVIYRISPIQRPHYITSSYTYQFFEKSYSCIVFRVKDC